MLLLFAPYWLIIFSMLDRLLVIKVFHSLIAFFMLGCLFYILYAGITATFNWFLPVAIVAIFIEGGALILNEWRCPLTTLAENWGAEKGSVVDLFMPGIIARNTFKWAPAIFGAELILLGIRYFVG
ncbi:hypothetical protein ACFLU1_06445 [Chloroflexota bacterium]